MSGQETSQTVLPKGLREELRQKALDHLMIHNRQWNELAEPDGLQIFTHGDGVRVVDAEGTTFIDAMSGLWSVNVGHGRKEIADAVYKQMRDLEYINTFVYTSVPAIELANKLAQITPSGISKAFFVNSGSEAVETAIKMAKQYHFLNGDQKKTKIISRRGSYHGTTLGALSANGSTGLRLYSEPLAPGFVHVPNVNCYRCDYGLCYPECKVLCVEMFEKTIQFENPQTVAAVLAEPISTSHGSHMPPKEYWPRLREICDKNKVLLIADEVINGFGRTGKWFGMEHFEGVIPDMMTVAKGLTSSYLPMSAVLVKDAVADRFKGGRKDAFSHGITFGTHPVSSAAALKNIEIIESENMVENSAEMGAYLLSRLKELLKYELVGDVRGVGLMCCVELVKDRETKEAFTEADDLQSKLTPKLVSRGLLTRAGQVINLAPPLCVTKAEIDEMVEILDQSLAELESEILVTA